jgi:hypothetical protein
VFESDSTGGSDRKYLNNTYSTKVVAKLVILLL